MFVRHASLAEAMEFTYRREGSKSFLETVEAVERSVRAHGFVVLRRHDLQSTLASKGFTIQPLIIMDVAHEDRDADLCKLHIYADRGAVWVIAIRPNALVEDGAHKARGAAELEASLTALVDSAIANG